MKNEEIFASIMIGLYILNKNATTEPHGKLIYDIGVILVRLAKKLGIPDDVFDATLSHMLTSFSDSTGNSIDLKELHKVFQTTIDVAKLEPSMN
jgi:hypothetical protein